jgi:acetyltransferase-like isoleucine patch superfamily enzyme
MKSIKLILRKIVYFIISILGRLSYDRQYLVGRYFDDITSIGWKWVWLGLLSRFFLRVNLDVPWPCYHTVRVGNPKNIFFNPDDLHIFQSGGTYFQAIDGKIFIGKNTWIAPNVGIITTNHDLYNLDLHQSGKDIILGESCWLGMNSVVLSGVVLGPHTVVAAGAVVTRSFIEGYCVLAGVPAKCIKLLSEDKE